MSRRLMVLWAPRSSVTASTPDSSWTARVGRWTSAQLARLKANQCKLALTLLVLIGVV